MPNKPIITNPATPHDEWFRGQVQDALDDPRPSFVTHEQAAARLVAYAGKQAEARLKAEHPKTR